MPIALLSRTPLALLLASLLLPACAPDDDETALRSLLTGGNSGGGTVFNTHALDDRELSELAPLGYPHVVAAIEGITLAKGGELAEVAVDTGELVGLDAEGREHRGDDWIGSEWTISFNMGIVDYPMFLLGAQVLDGVPHYEFYHHRGDVEYPNCPEGQDGPGLTRVLQGFSIDEATGEVTAAPQMIYLACDTGATGKAAALGYYDVAVASQDMGLLETAIRAIRADYCYDGQSHTEPGVEVIFEDVWGIRGTGDDSYKRPVEAVWGPDGLLCRGEGRLLDIDCPEDNIIPPCEVGDTFADYPDALFITRLR